MSVEFNLTTARRQVPIPTPPFHEWTLPNGAPWLKLYRTAVGYLLRFDEMADFQISEDGRAVECVPAPGVGDATPQHLYLNQVLPLALSRMGKLVFHGSAVNLDGQAVAFVAESGRGKSTLAASFAASGSPFLTDDGLILEPSDAGYEVMPSHPSIRLWKDSEDALIAGEAETAPPLAFTPKTRFLAGAILPFCDVSRPLRRVYFLGEGRANTVAIEPMSPAEALMGWVGNSFLLDIEAQPLLASHFDRLAVLAGQPIHYRLDFPRRYEALAEVRRAVAEHARKEG